MAVSPIILICVKHLSKSNHPVCFPSVGCASVLIGSAENPDPRVRLTLLELLETY